MHETDIPPQDRVAVWDLATRAFHWLLVALLGFSWVSGELGGSWLKWHFWSGYTILTLVVFRIFWGFIGSSTARFASFIRGPAAAFAHLRHVLNREPDREIGHNPLGGWMIVVMLLCLLLQAGTGLFANDDIMIEGPLAAKVSSATSAWLTTVHKLNFRVIVVLGGLHILAVIAYLLVARQNLIGPMLTGSKKREPGMLPPARLVGFGRALIALAVAALIVYGIVNLG